MSIEARDAMRRASRTLRWIFALFLVAGCGSSNHPAAPLDAGAGDGGADSDDAQADDAQAGACDEACRTTTLTARFGDVEEPFERAVYGVTAATGALHIEALHGGFVGCPTEDAPTPNRTLVIAGVTLPFSAPATYDDGVRASLLDFKGTLSSEPIARATSVVATPRAYENGAFVAFELDAVYAGGTIRGHVFAVHCASLDE